MRAHGQQLWRYNQLESLNKDLSLYGMKLLCWRRNEGVIAGVLNQMHYVGRDPDLSWRDAGVKDAVEHLLVCISESFTCDTIYGSFMGMQM